MQSNIATKGQVTVPKPIRDRLRLNPGDKIDFIVDADGKLRIAPATASVKDLKAMVPKPRKPVTLAQMNEAIARA